MNRARVGSAMIALAAMIAGGAWGNAQTTAPAPAEAAADRSATIPETLSVRVLNRIPDVDRGNLKEYWPEVQDRTKEQWTQALPRLAKSLPSGEVKVVCWLHTDGRVTNVALEQRSGNGALDRSALAAITGSAPYDAFPYGISVNQVKVRFTFDYDGGSGADAGSSGSSGSTGKPANTAAPANGGSLKLPGAKTRGPVQ